MNNIRGLLLVGGAKCHDKLERREMLSAFIGAEYPLPMTDDMEILTPNSLSAFGGFVNLTTL